MFTICGRDYLTKREFDAWVRNMVQSYNTFAKTRNNIKCYQHCECSALDPILGKLGHTRDTVIINLRNYKVAFAKCHRDDEFRSDVGVAIAWARYNNKLVPNVIENAKANKLNIGDKVYYTDSVVLGVCEAYFAGTVYDDATKQVKYLFNVGTVKNPCDRYFAVSDLSSIYVLE